jgi:hypothetical protein
MRDPLNVFHEEPEGEREKVAVRETRRKKQNSVMIFLQTRALEAGCCNSAD